MRPSSLPFNGSANFSETVKFPFSVILPQVENPHLTLHLLRCIIETTMFFLRAGEFFSLKIGKKERYAGRKTPVQPKVENIQRGSLSIVGVKKKKK